MAASITISSVMLHLLRTACTVLLIALAIGCATQSQYDALELRTYTDSIGYATVPEAQAVLSSRQDVTVSVGGDGWTYVREQHGATEFTVWSFVAADRPAYPTAVVITDRPSRWERRIRCEAAPDKCEQWLRETRREIQKMLEEI
jgi:hypothetical protein